MLLMIISKANSGKFEFTINCIQTILESSIRKTRSQYNLPWSCASMLWRQILEVFSLFLILSKMWSNYGRQTLSSLEILLCPLPHHHISTIILTVIGSLNKLKNFHLITASFWGLGGYNVFILFKILRCYFQENIQYILRKHFSISHLRNHNGDEIKVDKFNFALIWERIKYTVKNGGI